MSGSVFEVIREGLSIKTEEATLNASFGTYDLSILETASHFNSEKSVRIKFEEF